MATQLAPENVVGRDKLIQSIWKKLKRYSAIFTAERRIGKTTVMQKMQAEAPDGIIVIYLDLEGIDSPAQFIEVLLGEASGLLPKIAVAKGVFTKLLDSIGGTEIAGMVKIPAAKAEHWKSVLVKTFDCICEHQTSNLLFLFDELPYMLQKISINEGKLDSAGNDALTILDTLRAIRASNSNLKMIYSGSIGLHHVVNSLRDNTYASQPLNDMEIIEIGPIDQSSAKELAKRLMDEEEIECDDQDNVLTEIVELTDRVPFYIERLIRRLDSTETAMVTVEDVRNQILSNLTDDNDHWEMEHFRTRIPIYYPGMVNNTGDRLPIIKATVATEILDMLATEEAPQSIDQIDAAIKSKLTLEDRPLIIALLRNLNQDHYLVCDGNKNYSFRFPLIKRWWILAQGLSL